MDKLKPLIRNHFWILTALVVPLVLYGYYSANSSLKAATAEREKVLTDIKNGVSSGHEPNDDYIKKLEHINTFLEASVQDAIVDLWRKQQERMTWPQAVATRIPEEFMGQFDQQVPFIYKGLYPELIRRLQLRAQPVEPAAQDASGLGGVGPMDMTGRPMVPKAPIKTTNQKLILAGMVPHANFGQFGITSQEMWDAQIDIWLTEILIDAIVKMNADKESISESVIRRIDLIELVGGDGQPVTKDGGASADGMGMGMGMGMEGGMGMPGMGGPQQIPTTISFSPEEEFGRSLDGGAADGGMGMGMGMGMEGGPGGASAAAPPKRYIAETEEAPFLERGFYLSVIIMQTKIPDFIVTLANSDWPVQVRRFQVGVNPYRVDQSTTSQGFGAGMGMGMGMEGGFPMAPSRGRIGGTGMGGMRGMSGMGGMEGMMPGNDRGRGQLTNIYGGNIPEFAVASLNHPDLVQLDLCGVITLYKQPKEALAAVAARPQPEPAATVPAVEMPVPSAVPDPAVPATPLPESAEGLSEESAPVNPNMIPAAPGSTAPGSGAAPPAAGNPAGADLTPVAPGTTSASPTGAPAAPPAGNQ